MDIKYTLSDTIEWMQSDDYHLRLKAEYWQYFCFNVPQTLWRFQNGAFSWLGDTTTMTDLAYWYNGRAVQIILAKDE